MERAHEGTDDSNDNGDDDDDIRVRECRLVDMILGMWREWNVCIASISEDSVDWEDTLVVIDGEMRL